MKVHAIACDDNSKLGRVEGSTIEIYHLVGEMDLREGESVYSLLHGIDDDDIKDRVVWYR